MFMTFVSAITLNSLIPSVQEGLNSILKSLNDYLMLKEELFQDYFLSNEELILILSNSQDITTIQKNIVF